MRNVLDPEPAAPSAVSAGERFIILSDADVWDSSLGCEVVVFVRDYRPATPPEPYLLSDEVFREATLEGKLIRLSLDELIDYYIRGVFLKTG